MKRFASVLALGIVALGVSVYGGANDGIIATPQAHPTENVLHMTIHSENMVDAGRVAAYTGGQALVFAQDCPPGRCNYGMAMNFNVPGGGPLPGMFLADNAGMENGFEGGDAVSAIFTNVFRSSGDPAIGLTDANIRVELWDGDPFGWYDTPAEGYAGAKIAGSELDFVIPVVPGAWGGMQVDLYGEYTTPVVATKDRVWVVLTSDCCRLYWDFGYQHPKPGYDDIPESSDLGLMNVDFDGYALGYGSCCYTGGGCNELSGPYCMCYQGTGADYCYYNGFGVYDQCSDGDAESSYWFTTGGCTADPATTRCANFQIKLWAATDNVISLIPVYGDTIGTTTSSEWEIVGNAINMENGNRDVWMEWMVADWDPPPWTCMGEDTAPKHGLACVVDLDDPLYPTGAADCPWTDPFGVQDSWCGIHLKAWQISMDSTGYSSGLEGTLAPQAYACLATSQCTVNVGNGSLCVGGFCEAGFMDQLRADYVYNNPYVPPGGSLPGMDLSTLDYRWGATLTTGLPVPPPQMNVPPRGDQYLGTLVVDVPSDAKGTFEIYAKPVPDTVLLSMLNQPMPKLGVIPGIINVELGQCCFGLGTGTKEGCVDNITLDQCPDAGLCHGVCEDTTTTCMSDTECTGIGTYETCSGVCAGDGVSTCWDDTQCPAGLCTDGVTPCWGGSPMGDFMCATGVCIDGTTPCDFRWDCFYALGPGPAGVGICAGGAYYCWTDEDCPPGELCNNPAATGTCSSICNGSDYCVGAAGAVCLPQKEMDCIAGQQCVVSGASVFISGQDCSYPCAECTVPGPSDPKCGDGDACTVDVCGVDLFCTNTAVTVAGDECCDPTCTEGDADDLGGLGAIESNVDYACDGACGDACTDVHLAGDACVDDSGCIGAGKCLALNICTDDACSAPGTCAVGAQCGIPTNTANTDTCYDGVPCLTVLDTCAAGNCEGLDIIAIPCTNTAYCESITQTIGSCDFVQGNCICVPPSMEFVPHLSQKPNGLCYAVGETILVDVIFANVGPVVNGAQFQVQYDPTCLAFNSISPGGAPYITELAEMVDEAAGTIFYAIGVDPFGGVGQNGTGVLAQISFTKIGVCETCDLCFGGTNPLDTVLVDPFGQIVPGVVEICSDDIMENDVLDIDCPDDVVTNIDCDTLGATVTWDPPTASGSCYPVGLVCGGNYPDMSVIPQAIVMNGGEFPIGVSTFWCIATSTVCGDSVDCDWTVEVVAQTSLDVTIQLSPIIAANNLLRCIKFELFADTIQAPYIFEKDILFGGILDHVGHFTDAIKIPTIGQWMCITARDQLHTLRACDWLVCEDGVYSAIFKGDPAYGGNWLIGGNLDGWKKNNPNASHDVIDILDFGQFVAQFGWQGNPNTPCGTQGPHADINGDGTVDALDFTFVDDNFLASSKECCAGGIAGTTPLTEVTVEQLRQMGLGDLSVGDLNGDGVLNVDDMSAFLAGEKPGKSIRGVKGSSLR